MNNDPWWTRLLPDQRGWAAIGMFGVVFYLLYLIGERPALAANELFKTVAILLLGSGGFGMVLAYLYGGNKTHSDAQAAAQDPPAPPPDPAAAPPTPAPSRAPSEKVV